MTGAESGDKSCVDVVRIDSAASTRGVASSGDGLVESLIERMQASAKRATVVGSTGSIVGGKKIREDVDKLYNISGRTISKDWLDKITLQLE